MWNEHVEYVLEFLCLYARFINTVEPLMRDCIFKDHPSFETAFRQTLCHICILITPLVKDYPSSKLACRLTLAWLLRMGSKFGVSLSQHGEIRNKMENSNQHPSSLGHLIFFSNKKRMMNVGLLFLDGWPLRIPSVYKKLG